MSQERWRRGIPRKAHASEGRNGAREAARLAGARNSAMIHTGNILEFESVALPDVGILRAVDLAGEHLERTYPQRTVIIQFAIHHHRQAGLGIRGEILHKIPVALEMTVDAAAEDATAGVRLREGGRDGFGWGAGGLGMSVPVAGALVAGVLAAGISAVYVLVASALVVGIPVMIALIVVHASHRTRAGR